MKFLPTSRSVVLLALAASLCSCDTAANRRELYNTSAANGPWHDYERRREAVEQTGTTGVDVTTTTTTVRGRPTRVPSSAPVPVVAPPSGAAPVAPPPPALPDAAVPPAPVVPPPAAPAPAPDAVVPATPQ